jgi:Ser/Thr protein kinase RdoA (MazF antagonist)
MQLQPNIEEIIRNFKLEGTFLQSEVIPTGFINDTYIIKTKEPNNPDYILQKINHHIFKNVPELQHNIIRVTDHIRKKLTDKHVTDISRKVITLIPATNGKWFHQDSEGNFWRVLIFIPGSHSYDKLSSPVLAYKAGLAFGEFSALLTDMPGEPLYETIKDFHNMEWRLQQFRDAVNQNRVNRLEMVKEEVSQIEKRAAEMCRIQILGREGKLPRRITHCDTKINNVLFDENDEILCVIDLDTVMSGYVSSDFGDAIRTGANSGQEDDVDLNKVSLNIELYKGYAEGFITGGASFLTKAEIEILPFSAKLFAYMQAVRFLADFINGDTYYKTRHSMHNLERTKAQLKLLFSMEEQYGEMQRIAFQVATEKCKNYV